VLISRQRDRRQNADDRNDDHQFDQGKTLLDAFHGLTLLGALVGWVPPWWNAEAVPATKQGKRSPGCGLVHGGYRQCAALRQKCVLPCDASGHPTATPPYSICINWPGVSARMRCGLFTAATSPGLMCVMNTLVGLSRRASSWPSAAGHRWRLTRASWRSSSLNAVSITNAPMRMPCNRVHNAGFGPVSPV